MIGIFIYIYFLLLGYAYSRFVFKDKDLFFSIWMGGIFGNLILMVGIVIPAIVLGFNITSHIVLMIIALLPLIFLLKKHGIRSVQEVLKPAKNDCGMDRKVFLLLIIPFTILISILLTNHILVPTENGGYVSGQSTYGDLNMHLGFVTSIAEQGKFPPDYAFLSGYKLNYPFFINMLSSSLYIFGTSLRFAVLIPSYVFALLLVMGFYYLGYKITNRKVAAVIATIFFFLCGGFGFAYFLDGAKADQTVFTNMFTEFYKTPTNLNEHNIRWSNTICDMIIPQRTTMAGWCIILPALWLLIDAVKTKNRKSYILLGVIAGCMPMIHTHSFLALGLICAAMFFAYLFSEKTIEDKKKFFINWVIFGGIVAILALPQLLGWTFQQTSENGEYFMRLHFNWVNEQDPYFWFYIKNWGIAALFVIPAAIYANKDNKKLFIGALAIIAVAELFLFQPNSYDNNKLFYIAYMIIIILVSDWLIYIWDKLKNVKGRVYLAVVILILGTLSGVLTVGREFNSGGQYKTFSKDMVEMSEYVKDNTPKDAIFLTSTTFINPIPSLSGRNIYVGSSLYVYFHGLGNEYYRRDKEVEDIYKAKYEEIKEFCNNKNISYIYVGEYEKNILKPNMDEINKFEKIATMGTETLYKVNN